MPRYTVTITTADGTKLVRDWQASSAVNAARAAASNLFQQVLEVHAGGEIYVRPAGYTQPGEDEVKFFGGTWEVRPAE